MKLVKKILSCLKNTGEIQSVTEFDELRTNLSWKIKNWKILNGSKIQEFKSKEFVLEAGNRNIFK